MCLGTGVSGFCEYKEGVRADGSGERVDCATSAGSGGDVLEV